MYPSMKILYRKAAFTADELMSNVYSCNTGRVKMTPRTIGRRCGCCTRIYFQHPFEPSTIDWLRSCKTQSPNYKSLQQSMMRLSFERHMHAFKGYVAVLILGPGPIYCGPGPIHFGSGPVYFGPGPVKTKCTGPEPKGWHSSSSGRGRGEWIEMGRARGRMYEILVYEWECFNNMNNPSTRSSTGF